MYRPEHYWPHENSWEHTDIHTDIDMYHDLNPQYINHYDMDHIDHYDTIEYHNHNDKNLPSVTGSQNPNNLRINNVRKDGVKGNQPTILVCKSCRNKFK